MSKKLLIEKRSGALEIALMEANRLLSYEREKDQGVEAEQIYLAVVDRIVKGVEACFVRLGKDTVGFLPFSECREKPRSGDKVLVQVKRPPTGEKAAYMTMDLSIAGRFSILTPFNRYYSISKRIEDPETREKLQRFAKKHAPKEMGVVMRQESAEAAEEEILSEMQELLNRWNAISEAMTSARPPCLLKERESPILRLLRDERGGIDEIIANCEDSLPALPLPVKYAEHPFMIYSVDAKLEKSLRRKIWLDCGGFLVIDPTEAMTVIDVNSGKFTGVKSGTESTFLKLNQEAAREIARILRLRKTGGVIIIDFVDMQEEESREQVKNCLQEALLSDPVKTVIHGFTSLGLLEMTRRKTEAAPSPAIIQCPRCHGTGYIEEKQ